MGVDKRVAQDHDRGGNFFGNFCFERVYFGAKKITNAVHHHWFSGGYYSERTDSRLIEIFVII